MMTDNNRIGQYKIRGKLGRGSMAQVYLAWDPERKEDIALKVLLPQYVSNPQIKRRFLREAAAIKRLTHPAIIPIYDFGEDGRHVYYAMKLLRGGTLAARIEERPLTGEQILFVLEPIANAVDHIHKLGIIHRDIKPSNILFNRYGHPFLADFGVIQLSQSRLTRIDSSFIGTPAYMSPEQVRSEELDGRSDLYALGIVLFEMLTGDVPYESDNGLRTAQMQIDEKIPSVQAHNPEINRRWQKIVNKALAKKREKRYQSGLTMVQAVQKIVASKSFSLGLSSQRFAQKLNLGKLNTDTFRFRWLTVAPALLGMLVLMAAGLYFLFTSNSDLDPGGMTETRIPMIIERPTDTPEEACTQDDDYQFEIGEAKLSPPVRAPYQEGDPLPAARFPITNEGCLLSLDKLELEPIDTDTEIAKLTLERDEEGQINQLDEGEEGWVVLSFEVDDAESIDGKWLFVVDALTLFKHPRIELVQTDWVRRATDEVVSVSAANTEQPTRTPTRRPTETVSIESVPTQPQPTSVPTLGSSIQPTMQPTSVQRTPVTTLTINASPSPYVPLSPLSPITSPIPPVSTADATTTILSPPIASPSSSPISPISTENATATPNWNATRTQDVQQSRVRATRTAQIIQLTLTKQMETASNNQTREAFNRQVTATAVKRNQMATVTAQAKQAEFSRRATQTRNAQIQKKLFDGTATVIAQNRTQQAWNQQATQTRQAEIDYANTIGTRRSISATQTRQNGMVQASGTRTRQAEISRSTATRQAVSAAQTRRITDSRATQTVQVRHRQATQQAWNRTATRTRQAEINRATATANARPQPTLSPVSTLPILINRIDCVKATGGFVNRETPFQWKGVLGRAEWFAIRVAPSAQSPHVSGTFVKNNITVEGRSNGTWSVANFDINLPPGNYNWTVALIKNNQPIYALEMGCVNNMPE